jgi:hypothetical protein
VPHCWVIDPERRTALEYHGGGEPAKLDSAGSLRAELSAPLRALFSGLDR